MVELLKPVAVVLLLFFGEHGHTLEVLRFDEH